MKTIDSCCEKSSSCLDMILSVQDHFEHDQTKSKDELDLIKSILDDVWIETSRACREGNKQVKIPSKEFCIGLINNSFEFNNVQDQYIFYLKRKISDSNEQFWNQLNNELFDVHEYVVKTIINY